jgi:uncharacterized protein YjiS (DUF1127 family)
MQNVSLGPRQQLAATQAQLAGQLHTPEWSRILDLTDALTQAFKRWRQRRASIRALQVLSDWQLKDIGVPRGDIPAIVDRDLSAAPRSGTGIGLKPRHAAVNRGQGQMAA